MSTLSESGAERESGDADNADPPHTTVQTLDQTVLDRWNGLRRASAATDPFSHPDIVVGLARALGWHVEPVFVESGGLEAGALLVRRRLGPLSQVVVPPFSPYSAVLLPDASDTETRTRLLSLLLDRARDISRDATIVLSPENSERSSLEPTDPWSTGTFQTYRSVTGPIKDVISEWSSSTRRTFRRGREEFEPVSGIEIVPDILEFVDSAYARHGRSLPVPRAPLCDLALSAIASGRARVIGVRRRETGDVEAGVVLLFSEECAWYWIAGSVPGSAMTACIGAILADCHERGIASFDFMGANTPSIAEFKRRFGGELVNYTVFETPRRALIRLATRVRRILPGGGVS